MVTINCAKDGECICEETVTTVAGDSTTTTAKAVTTTTAEAVTTTSAEAVTTTTAEAVTTTTAEAATTTTAAATNETQFKNVKMSAGSCEDLNGLPSYDDIFDECRNLCENFDGCAFYKYTQVMRSTFDCQVIIGQICSRTVSMLAVQSIVI